LGLAEASVGAPEEEEAVLRVEASPSLKTAREVEIGRLSRDSEDEGGALLRLSLSTAGTGTVRDNRRRAMKDICKKKTGKYGLKSESSGSRDTEGATVSAAALARRRCGLYDRRRGGREAQAGNSRRVMEGKLSRSRCDEDDGDGRGRDAKRGRRRRCGRAERRSRQRSRSLTLGLVLQEMRGVV
jgi:hypothetical protein